MTQNKKFISTKLSQPLRKTWVSKPGFRPILCLKFRARSPKFKRVLLIETPEFPFWGLNIRVDFYLRNYKKIESLKKPNKIKCCNENIKYIKPGF